MPEKDRNNIYGINYTLAGRPLNVEWNWSELHVFDSLPRLQQAIQKVAFEAFDSLPTNKKNYVAGRVYIHSGSPKTSDGCWGEHNAKKDVEVLLQSLDDWFTNDLPELSASLNSWATKSAPGENRQEAVKRIIGFLNSKAETTLDLSRCGLTTLPPIFNSDPFINRLTTLILKGNSLSKLPPEIGQLQALLELNVYDNQLTALPPEIGNLLALQKLYVSCNRLTALPPEIGLLQALLELNVSHNLLTALLPEIGKLLALQILDVSSNQLTALPPEIGQLRALLILNVPRNLLNGLPPEIGKLLALQSLDVSHNQLTALPPEISNLHELRFLLLGDNSTLSGVPTEMLQLHHDCQIDLEGAGFSEAVLARLNEVCNASGYNGPRISFSIRDAAPRAARSTDQLLKELFKLAGSDQKEFPKLLSSTITNQGNLNLWLSRLSETADYKRGGALQKAFAGKILKYLQNAENDEKFREMFFAIIDGAAATCGDRIALSILHISTANKLATIDTKDIKGLADLLINEVWPMQMLEKIARDKVDTLPLCDEIEVYLGYPIMLKERLKMPIDVGDMLYFRCSYLTPKDLDEAAKHVQKQQNDVDKKCRFLIDQDKWIESLKVNYQKQFDEIDNGSDDEEEPDYEKLGKLREEKLIALTAWALCDNNKDTSCGTLVPKHSDGKMEE